MHEKLLRDLKLWNICPDWLRSCLDYISSTSPQSTELLQTQILFSDLSSLITQSVFDTNHSSQFLAQINDIQEIGISKQSLLGQIQNKSVQRQMLKLTLTDGISQFFGVELEHIHNIRIDMLLGAKIIINGCKLSRGVMLLKNENITFVGGHVEELNELDPWVRIERQVRKDLGLEVKDIPEPAVPMDLSSAIQKSNNPGHIYATAEAPRERSRVVEITSDDYFDNDMDWANAHDAVVIPSGNQRMDQNINSTTIDMNGDLNESSFEFEDANLDMQEQDLDFQNSYDEFDMGYKIDDVLEPDNIAINSNEGVDFTVPEYELSDSDCTLDIIADEKESQPLDCKENFNASNEIRVIESSELLNVSFGRVKICCGLEFKPKITLSKSSPRYIDIKATITDLSFYNVIIDHDFTLKNVGPAEQFTEIAQSPSAKSKLKEKIKEYFRLLSDKNLKTLKIDNGIAELVGIETADVVNLLSQC